jgi:hypothetical protein
MEAAEAMCESVWPCDQQARGGGRPDLARERAWTLRLAPEGHLDRLAGRPPLVDYSTTAGGSS